MLCILFYPKILELYTFHIVQILIVSWNLSGNSPSMQKRRQESIKSIFLSKRNVIRPTALTQKTSMFNISHLSCHDCGKYFSNLTSRSVQIVVIGEGQTMNSCAFRTCQACGKSLSRWKRILFKVARCGVLNLVSA